MIKCFIVLISALSLTALGFSCIQGGKLDTITITPASPTIAPGTSKHLTATAHFTDGTTISWTSAVNWTSSDTDFVTIGNSTDSYGLATSKTGTGEFTINATDEANGISGSTILTVEEPIAVTVTPFRPFMAIGTTHQFTATAIFSNTTGTQNLTSFATWTTNESIASISSPGLVTALTTSGTSTTEIKAVYKDVAYTAFLTVTETPLVSITVTPDDANIPPEKFKATGNYAETAAEPTHDFTASVDWSSSDDGVATVDDTGLITIKGPGATTITATDPITNISGSIEILL